MISLFAPPPPRRVAFDLGVQAATTGSDNPYAATEAVLRDAWLEGRARGLAALWPVTPKLRAACEGALTR